MNRALTTGLAALLALMGCAPLEVYYREGVAVDKLRRDQTNCAVSALRDAPVANQIRRSPARYVPGRRVCDSHGHCRYYGGYWIPGEIYSVDVNAPLRRTVERQCMADKGYAPVEIPRCPDSVRNAAPPTITRVLPQLTPETCIIPYNEEDFLIVNRG